MICFPNAKINLGLRVLRKRSDGYHDIETVFVPIPLTDILELVPVVKPMHDNPFLSLGADCRLYYSYSGYQFIGNAEEDLTVRACRLYAQKFGVSTSLHLHLHKNIPSGAGLGGGSSDAAHALKLLNELEGNKADTSELLQMAASLGSDCPFFIWNKPCYATGRGEVLSEFDCSLAGCHLVMVKPPFGVATAEAYSGVHIGSKNEPVVSLKKLLLQPRTQWEASVFNDFEPGVFQKHPRLNEIKSELYKRGAFYASMSGSGSAMFGLFLDTPDISGCFNDDFTFMVTL